MFQIDPLTTLEEALALAKVRNACRLFMTNNQNIISLDDQKKWFVSYQEQIKYRVWLLKKDTLIGYFAAKEAENLSFFITLGLSEAHRGQGAGTFLLQNMLKQEHFQKKELLADIFDHNFASIALHKKCGFVPQKKVSDSITRYYLLC